jgi:hypothetical protein
VGAVIPDAIIANYGYIKTTTVYSKISFATPVIHTVYFINNTVYGRDKLATLFRQDIGGGIIMMRAGIVHCAVSDWKDEYRRRLRRGDVNQR